MSGTNEFEGIFLNVTTQEYTEADDIFAIDFEDGFVEPLPAKIDPWAALPHVIMAGPGIEGLLEHGDT